MASIIEGAAHYAVIVIGRSAATVRRVDDGAERTAQMAGVPEAMVRREIWRAQRR